VTEAQAFPLLFQEFPDFGNVRFLRRERGWWDWLNPPTPELREKGLQIRSIHDGPFPEEMADWYALLNHALIIRNQ
jgi:hypothetical protein